MMVEITDNEVTLDYDEVVPTRTAVVSNECEATPLVEEYRKVMVRNEKPDKCRITKGNLCRTHGCKVIIEKTSTGFWTWLTLINATCF